MILKSPYDRHNDGGVKTRSAKIKLFYKKKGKCCYCKCKTQIVTKPEWKGNEPYNLATIEHVYPRWDIRRSLSRKTKLACLKCNREKNIEFENKLYEGYDENEVCNLIEILNQLQWTT